MFLPSLAVLAGIPQLTVYIVEVMEDGNWIHCKVALSFSPTKIEQIELTTISYFHAAL